jgi:hypothetical protein
LDQAPQELEVDSMWALRGVRPRSDVGPLDSDNDGDNIVGRHGHRAAAQRGPGAPAPGVPR